ncbi:MAG: DNA-3-methyladenine glycosylase family protein [Chthoniobacterales bacterium]
MKGVRPEKIACPDFDLSLTLHSGQVFHWRQCGDGFVGTIDELPVYVEQRGDLLEVTASSRRGSKEHWQDVPATLRRYFALDHPLPKICASFPGDDDMRAAAEFCLGLRVIRQPAWECLATFITSSMKQVAHIRQMSRALRERYGKSKTTVGETVYTFPSVQRVAQLSEAELRECALGYRAKNLLATAKRIASGEADIEAWRALSDDELRARLCTLSGVGAKVANCVMLFAYERLGAFPIDVWIERVLKEKYFLRKRNVTAKQLRDFCANYFGAHGGYAQQYLFHHARMTRPRRKAVERRGAGAKLSQQAKCGTVPATGDA